MLLKHGTYDIERFTGQLKQLHGDYINANEQLLRTNAKVFEQMNPSATAALAHAEIISKTFSQCAEEVKQHSDDMHKRFTHIHGDMQQWLLSQLNASNSGYSRLSDLRINTSVADLVLKRCHHE